MTENGSDFLPFEPPEQENVHLREENARLRRILAAHSIPIPKLAPENPPPAKATEPTAPVDKEERARKRIALFRSLFRGREDVYARRWEDDDGRHGYMPAHVKDWKAINKSRLEDRKKVAQKTRKFFPMTDAVIEQHLLGEETIGVYPLLPDETCWFLAADFDKKTWEYDALAFPVFIDADFNPYPDQWQLLSTIRRMAGDAAEEIVAEAQRKGDLIGVRMSIADDEGAQDPWTLPPSRKRRERPMEGPLPKTVQITRANLAYVEKKDLPPAMLNRLLRLAAFQNPEFYKAQAMRLPTYNKPRVIACGQEFPQHIAVPRGCLAERKPLRRSPATTKASCALRRHSGRPPLRHG